MLVVSAMIFMTVSPSLAKGKAMMMKESAKAVKFQEVEHDLWIGHIFWVKCCLGNKNGRSSPRRRPLRLVQSSDFHYE